MVQIVVLSNIGMVGEKGVRRMYRQCLPETHRARLAIRVEAPARLPGRVSTIADESIRAQIEQLMPLDEAGANLWLESQYLSRLLVGVSALALLVSLMAIYSVLAFTVSKRTREIGVRVALGADAVRLTALILRRPFEQIASGVLAGGCVVGLMSIGLREAAPTGKEAALILAYAILMMAVCMLACSVPTRRALRLQPSDALRADI